MYFRSNSATGTELSLLTRVVGILESNAKLNSKLRLKLKLKLELSLEKIGPLMATYDPHLLLNNPFLLRK